MAHHLQASCVHKKRSQKLRRRTIFAQVKKKEAMVFFAPAKIMSDMQAQNTISKYREVLFAQHARVPSRTDLKMNRKKLGEMKRNTLCQTRKKYISTLLQIGQSTGST